MYNSHFISLRIGVSCRILNYSYLLTFLPRLEKREQTFLLSTHCFLLWVVICSEGFPLPLGALYAKSFDSGTS